MERHFARLLDEKTPKFNPEIVSGLAYTHLPYIETYIDSVMRSSAKTLPEGIEYLGYERVTPREEYTVITKLRENKHTYEMARSDLYMVKYNYSFRGEPLPHPRYMYLPYVTKGGLIHLGGTLYHISPVLTDRVITPTQTNVFARLLRDKIIFERVYHNVRINNEKKPMQVIWAIIYRNKRNTTGNRVTQSTKAVTAMVHYLLAKYGVTEMFEKFLGFTPVIGESDVNVKNYPSDKWTVYESTRTIPSGWRGGRYTPHNISIAIPNDKVNVFTENVIGGFFYVLDHFPEYVGLDMLDDKRMWMILLGHINFSENYSMEKLYSSMEEHFISLDSYIDDVIREKLHDSGYKIDNFYDLIGLILENFNNWVIHSKEFNNNIYNRYLDVNYYVLYDITSGIFKANFELVKLSRKKEIVVKNIEDIFNKHMSPRRIYQLVKTSNPNISTSVVDYSGDNLYPKITSIVALQESGAGVKRARRSGLPPSSRVLTGPDLALGSLLFLTKKLPTPKVRVNPFARIQPESGVIDPDPEIKETLEILNEMLSGVRPEDIV